MRARLKRGQLTPALASGRPRWQVRCCGSRAAALASEVLRLEEAARELELRIESRQGEREQTRTTRDQLLAAIEDGEKALDEQIRALDELRVTLRSADDAAGELRTRVDAQDAVIREARRALEEIRAEAGELEVARATAESDLTHLAQTCVDAVQATLDEVLADVEKMEAAGEATPDAAPSTAGENEPADAAGE